MRSLALVFEQHLAAARVTVLFKRSYPVIPAFMKPVAAALRLLLSCLLSEDHGMRVSETLACRHSNGFLALAAFGKAITSSHARVDFAPAQTSCTA